MNLFRPTYDPWPRAMRDALNHETKLCASELEPGHIIRVNGTQYVVDRLSILFGGFYLAILEGVDDSNLYLEICFKTGVSNDDPVWTLEGKECT